MPSTASGQMDLEDGPGLSPPRSRRTTAKQSGGRTAVIIAVAVGLGLVATLALWAAWGQWYVDRQRAPHALAAPDCSAKHEVVGAPTAGSSDDAVAAWLNSGVPSAESRPPLAAWQQIGGSSNPTTYQFSEVYRVPDNNAAGVAASCVVARTNGHGWQVVAVGS